MYQDEHEKYIVRTDEMSISYNEQMRLVHIAFAHKPADEVRMDLREHNWRWNAYHKVWQRSLGYSGIWDEIERFTTKWQVKTDHENPQITKEELEIAKKFLPYRQYQNVLALSNGEEGVFFRKKIHELAGIVERLSREQEMNADGTHWLGLKYFLGQTRIYITELDASRETAFAYCVLNGDTQMSEWGYMAMNEIVTLPGIELDLYIDAVTVEEALHLDYPTAFPEINEHHQKEKNLTDADEISYHIMEETEHKEQDNDSSRHRDRAVPADTQADDERVRVDTGNSAMSANAPGSEYNESGKGVIEAGAGFTGGQGNPRGELAGSDNNSAPEQFPQNSFINDSDSSDKLGNSHVSEDEHANNRSKYSVGTGTTGKRSVKEIRTIRQQCIQLLAQKQADFTAAEIQLLKQYEGAGGLAEKNTSSHGVLYEFYTPALIVDAVWRIIDSYYPENPPLDILEPSGGIGRFLDNRPANNTFTVYEIDSVSARINAVLHPSATIYNEAYQQQFFDESARIHTGKGRDKLFDIVVGNPPFGTYSGQWKGKGEGKNHQRYEEYFLEKGLDALKDNGLLAYVLPSGFLSSVANTNKEIIAQKGCLVTAWRLPEQAFETTKTGTDIVVFKKGRGSVTDISGDKYFHEHPDHILGDVRTRRNRYGREETFVALPVGTSLEKLLQKIRREAVCQSYTTACYSDRKIFPASNEYIPSVPSVMSARDFCNKYGRTYDVHEIPVWQATAYNGYIDSSVLTEPDKAYMRNCGNYFEVENGKWMHRELYLSGNIYEKLSELDNKRLELTEETYEKNKEALEAVIPPRIPLHAISFSPKSELAKEFMVSIGEHRVNLQEGFINWVSGYIDEKDKSYGRMTVDFCVSPISKEDIPENIGWGDIVEYIDGVPVKAQRSYSDEEKAVHTIEAEKKRDARRECADMLFNRYVHEGLEKTAQEHLEQEWNRRFNAIRLPDYSKLPLFIDGMSAYKGDIPFTLYEQQLKGIAFLCNKGNGLLAYEVGVGKTAAGIVATVNQIQTGRSLRPLIMVPKAVYDKWYRDLCQLFPQITINPLGNFSNEILHRYRDPENPHALNIKASSISLCTIEALQRISFTDESIQGALYEDFSNLLGVQEQSSEREAKIDVEKIKERIGSASQTKDGFIFWEQSGFDHITVDEAHRFKNLYSIPRNPERGKADEYKGLGSGNPSTRALKLFAITQLVQRANQDRNVFLLTATPFTNSPLEVYSMLSYMCRKELKERHIYNLYSFLNEFAQMKSEWAITPSGQISTKLVMKNFRQLPALQNLLQEYFDKVDAQEAGIIRPTKITHVEKLDMSPLQKQIVDAEINRMVHDVRWIRMGGVLVSMNNMRMAMLSPALLQNYDVPGITIPELSRIVECSPKLQFVLDSVAESYQQFPDGGQVIYVPRGVNEYPYLKEYLIKQGVPSDAIACMDASTTEKQKERITSSFNDKKGKVKVIIGSETISEGVDLNGNSFALYNTMLGWNPTETVQVEGRIHRQGNAQGTVHIIYPLINDSIDSLIYQKHDEKSSRIDALWSYRGDTLNVEDINPEELKFDLIKDPRTKARFMIDQQTADMTRDIRINENRINVIEEILTSRETLIHQIALDKEAIEQLCVRYPGQSWVERSNEDKKKSLRKSEQKLSRLDTKLEKMGLTDEAKITACITELKERTNALREEVSQIKETYGELVKKLSTEANENKILLPSLQESRKALTASILNNLRPAICENKPYPDVKQKRETQPSLLLLSPAVRTEMVQKVLFDENNQGMLFDFSELPVTKPTVKLKENTAEHFIENVIIRGEQLQSNIKAYQELFTQLESKAEQRKVKTMMKNIGGTDSHTLKTIISSWSGSTDVAALNRQAVKPVKRRQDCLSVGR